MNRFYLNLPRNRKALVKVCQINDEDNEGDCTPVRGKAYNYLIRVDSRLSYTRKIEILLHELQHAMHWQDSEYKVDLENSIRGIALGKLRRMRRR